MSISSDSEPPYNEFYDKKEVSDVESEGFIDTTVEKKGFAKKRKVEPETSALGALLAPFEGCCFTAGPPSGQALRHAGTARVSGPLAEFVLQTSDIMDEYGGLSDGSSSSEDDIAPGAAPVVYKSNKERRRAADAASEALAAVKTRLEADNIKWASVITSRALDATAKWKIEIPLMQCIELGYTELTNDQRRLGALYWCAAITLSQKMSPQFIEKIVAVARWELPEEMSFEQAMRKRDEFATLVMRREGRDTLGCM